MNNYARSVLRVNANIAIGRKEKNVSVPANYILEVDKDIDQLEYQIYQLREALEFIEWRYHDSSFFYCPWCQGEKPNHESFCQRQIALGLAEAENENPE